MVTSLGTIIASEEKKITNKFFFNSNFFNWVEGHVGLDSKAASKKIKFICNNILQKTRTVPLKNKISLTHTKTGKHVHKYLFFLLILRFIIHYFIHIFCGFFDLYHKSFPVCSWSRLLAGSLYTIQWTIKYNPDNKAINASLP